MANDEDKLVTKPFKFVTGKCSFIRSLSAVDTDIHGSRSAPSALTFLRNTWTEASCVHGNVTDQYPMSRLRCAISQSEPVRVPSFYFCEKGLISCIEPSTAGKIMSTTTNAFWPKAKILLHAVRYVFIDIWSRFSCSSLLSSSSLPTGHSVLVLGVNAGTVNEVRPSLPMIRIIFNSVDRGWQFPSRS